MHNGVVAAGGRLTDWISLGAGLLGSKGSCRCRGRGGKGAKRSDGKPWWTAGIFAVGAITGGALLRPGPLHPASTPPPAHAEVTTAQTKADPALPG
jgi:hypothetical protein